MPGSDDLSMAPSAPLSGQIPLTGHEARPKKVNKPQKPFEEQDLI